MPPKNDRSRPPGVANGSEKVIAATTGSVQPGYDVARQIRRRREASLRCPVLSDGRRDPLDPPVRPAPIEYRVIGRGTGEFVGQDKMVLAAIRAVGCNFQRARQGGAWLVPLSSADDVMAVLESRGFTVVMPF